MKAAAESHPSEGELSARPQPGLDVLGAIGQLAKMGVEARDGRQLVHIFEVANNQLRSLANF